MVKYLYKQLIFFLLNMQVFSTYENKIILLDIDEKLLISSTIH